METEDEPVDVVEVSFLPLLYVFISGDSWLLLSSSVDETVHLWRVGSDQCLNYG